jgi:hypothetical protein
MNTTPQPSFAPDDVARILVLVYGFLADEKPFWAYVAVKPSMYPEFQRQQAAGALDLYKFEPFGEVIVSGSGEAPPDDVTLRVAELYDTDPRNFFTTVDPEQEIAEKIAALKNTQDNN